ncbi:MAG: hypothetical protein IT162_05920 [Bryobacterales bacterium]|nr:hypothetical protein [Bryobacterales bacterium]
MRHTAASHFLRRLTPPTVSGHDYQVFREAVRKDFGKTCAYCLFEERWAAGVENFELDHFRPQSLFPQLRMSFYNPYWSCHVCNRVKRNQWPTASMREAGLVFVDLCADSFAQHFVELRNGTWRGRTPAARYTIDALRLNRSHLVELRQLLRRLAVNP